MDRTNRLPSSHSKKLLLGLFHGVHMTKRSVSALPDGPDYVVLYQKNIEAVCSTEQAYERNISGKTRSSGCWEWIKSLSSTCQV